MTVRDQLQQHEQVNLTVVLNLHQMNAWRLKSWDEIFYYTVAYSQCIARNLCFVYRQNVICTLWNFGRFDCLNVWVEHFTNTFVINFCVWMQLILIPSRFVQCEFGCILSSSVSNLWSFTTVCCMSFSRCTFSRVIWHSCCVLLPDLIRLHMWWVRKLVLALDLEGVHDVKLHHPSSSVATSNQWCWSGVRNCSLL